MKDRLRILAGILLAILVLRLALGALFGGTQDQRGYVMLWDIAMAHQNPYEVSWIMAWPPLWWMIVGVWSDLWEAVAVTSPGLAEIFSKSFLLKCLYFAFEIVLAGFLSYFIVKAADKGDSPASGASFLNRWVKLALGFLLIPATWVITSLHGNFDVIPAFFTVAAFLICQHYSSETGASVSSLMLGFGIMARTFPAIFAFPLLTEILVRHRWRMCLWSALLVALPTVLSMYPVYLLAPDAVEQKFLGYRGVLEGWWGPGALARLFFSDSIAQSVVRANLKIFFPVMLLVQIPLCYLLGKRRLSVFKAGLLTVLALFCFAPTVSNQNFYLLIPWAFWWAVIEGCKAARIFLWILSINLVLIYIIVPLDLENPIWFQWTYDFQEECLLPRYSSPGWLVNCLRAFAAVFKRADLDYNPFIQNVLRLPVWVVLWVWSLGELPRVLVLRGRNG